MAYSSWTSSMNSRGFQRQQCYLCDLPRAPWAILSDFSEPICRGCCNYEGPDRLETVIDYVRSLRKGYEHQARVLKAQTLNSTGNSIGSSPSPGGHSASSMDGQNAVVSISNSFGSYQGLVPGGPHHGAHGQDHFRFMKHDAHGNGPTEHGDGPKPSGFVVPGEPPLQQNGVPRNAEEAAAAAHEDHRRMMASLAAGKEPVARGMPNIRRPPEFGDFPDIVRETLEVLNSCVPFDVRFKKDHNHVGRVFLFEAAPRTGAASPHEHELKIHIEYPRGSEQFCQSASSVAKQMYQDSMKDFGRVLPLLPGLSSGFKYLEYEVQGSPNEFRLLGDLLPEPVRIFKEPVGRTLLPQRLTENPTFHPMLGPPMFGPGMASKFRGPKRKADVEMEPVPSRAPRRTYKEREDEQIQRHLWMQSQVDALRLSMNPLSANSSESAAAMHLNAIRGGSAPPPADHQRPPLPLPHAPLIPGGAGIAGGQPSIMSNVHQLSPSSHQLSPSAHSQNLPRTAPWNGVPSSMAALISAAASSAAEPQTAISPHNSILSSNGAGPGSLSRGPPPGAMPQQLKEPKKSPSSESGLNSAMPTSSLPPGAVGPPPPQQQQKPKSPSSGDKDSVQVKSEEQSVKSEDSRIDRTSPNARKNAPKTASQLKCSICADWLEDTHFVQCPSCPSHKFCFPCSKESIKKQAAGSDVFCPSGKRCPLIGSNLPWAFMQSEIQTILATKGHPKNSQQSQAAIGGIKDEASAGGVQQPPQPPPTSQPQATQQQISKPEQEQKPAPS